MKTNPSLAKSLLTRKSNSSDLHLAAIVLIICATFAIDDRTIFAADTGDLNSITTVPTWSIVPSPHQGGVKLYGVLALSPTQAWAVGDIYSTLTPNHLSLEWD